MPLKSAAQFRSPQRPVENAETLFSKPLPIWKRGIDILGAGLGLILLSPLMLIVSAAIRFTSPGSIIFKQMRAGLGGKPFVFYKFRTMVDGAEELKKDLLAKNEQTGPVFKIKKDPRVTPIGRFLRKTSIDELPQLWNVLKGDMSLVGPRPPTLDEVPQYETWQNRRLEATPGITCIWQVSGRNEIGFLDWVRMDIKYLRNINFFHDIKILLKTLPSVLLRKGAR